MNQPEEIRGSVSTSHARAVEQHKTSSRSCCFETAATAVLPSLAGYSRAALGGKVASIRVVGRKPVEVIP